MENIKNIKILYNENLSKHTSFRVGGKADYVIFPKDYQAIIDVINYLKEKDIKYIILGNGSNVLATDNGFRGAVIKLTHLTGMSITGNMLYVKAGNLLSKVGNFCLENNLSGFETLCGIPGTIGGAVFMNAGAYGSEISDILVASEFINQNGEIITLNKEEHNFSYRHSFYVDNPEYIIINAVFELKQGEKDQILAIMEDCKQKRADKQPIEFPSAGSTFKRPEGYFAGKLIEDAGLKGYTVGGAKVSEKHAGFVINDKNATCEDILTLISDVKRIVYDKFNVNLECEIKILGD